MPIRPKPTKQLLIELCGGNQGLIGSVHHGLSEVPLNEFYSNLNLNETIAFAAGSWDTRHRSVHNLGQNIDARSVYDIFSEVFVVGMPWLNGSKRISPELQGKYGHLNPFQGRNLRERLQRVPPEAVKKLKQRLSEEVNEYVFDCQYQGRKAARGGDNYKLEVMHFQNAYPKSGRIVPAFAVEVARMISAYPGQYELLPVVEQAPAQQVQPAQPAQPAGHMLEQLTLL